VLFLPAAAMAALPAQAPRAAQAPAQAPAKVMQAPMQAPTKSVLQSPSPTPTKMATAPDNTGYRTYSYQPNAAPMTYGYGYANGYRRPRTGSGFNAADYKVRGQW
jgi:hypothetical protein